MIIGNGFLVNNLPMTMMSAKVFVFNKTDKPFGYGVFDKTSSNPEGFGMKAINKPILGGSISAYSEFTIANSATLVAGVNIASENLFEIETTGYASLTGSLSGINEIEFDITANVAGGANMSTLNTMQIQTTASPTAVSNISTLNTIQFQNTGQISAIANLTTGQASTELTPASIWSYSDRTLTGAGGLSVEQQAQLDSIQNNTGLIPALL